MSEKSNTTHTDRYYRNKGRGETILGGGGQMPPFAPLKTMIVRMSLITTLGSREELRMFYKALLKSYQKFEQLNSSKHHQC